MKFSSHHSSEEGRNTMEYRHNSIEEDRNSMEYGHNSIEEDRYSKNTEKTQHAT
jgi:hypothetical protein